MVKFLFGHKNHITLTAGLLIIIGLTARFMGYLEAGNWVLILSTLISMSVIGVKAWQAVMVKQFSIDLLVTIAVIGALIINEYIESSMVTFLFMFGDYLEARTLEKTRSSLKKLTESAPQEALVLDATGNRQTIAVDEVAVGDHLVVLPGGKIPVDGRVIKGEGQVNEAAVTGESKPASKEIGANLFSGTILDAGYLEFEAEKVGADTTFNKIIELVEEAQDSKSKTEKFLNRFSQYYTPGVVILALIVYLITRNLHLAITFLVIACPGALVIGAPVSSVAGIGNGAKNGVLIKGGDVMERFDKVDTVIFDKTGTLTKGKPEVTEIHLFRNSYTAQNILGMTAKLEAVSEHHLGRAIVEKAKADGLDLDQHQLNKGEAVKARGVQGQVDGKNIVAGNRKMMEEAGYKIALTDSDYAIERERKGNSAIYVAVAGEVVGLISIADKIRPDAKSAIQILKENGIDRVVMLTGDNAHTARAVAEELGIDEFHAELMPKDKVAYVKEFKDQGAHIAMTGDGINDAPALATADIGIAMGEGGTDIAIETGDIVLMNDTLTQYVHAFLLSKATMRNMRQNIAIALAVVLFLLMGVLAGGVNLAIGMFFHEASVLIVILNAMRLLHFKIKKNQLASAR